MVFWSICSLLQLLHSAVAAWKPSTICKEMDKAVNIETWILYNFHTSRNIIHYLIFPQLLKMSKPFLSYGPCKIRIVDCSLPASVLDDTVSQPTLWSPTTVLEGNKFRIVGEYKYEVEEYCQLDLHSNGTTRISMKKSLNWGSLQIVISTILISITLVQYSISK